MVILILTLISLIGIFLCFKMHENKMICTVEITAIICLLAFSLTLTQSPWTGNDMLSNYKEIGLAQNLILLILSILIFFLANLLLNRAEEKKLLIVIGLRLMN
jgi:NADH:ubiquinone oxidoreductase subunit 2 (subunit N)